MPFLPHASDRLARAIVRVRFHDTDPRTFALWADVNNVTPNRLHAWCHAADVPGRSALAFARMLRAVTLVHQDRCRYEEVLDIAEPATLTGLLRKAGVSKIAGAGFGVSQFLARQTLLAQPLLVERVRELLDGEARRMS